MTEIEDVTAQEVQSVIVGLGMLAAIAIAVVVAIGVTAYLVING